MRRAFVVVLDAVGAGALPDADRYGDAGADTLGNLARVTGGLQLPTLARLGLGSIVPLRGAPAKHPVLHGRLHPLGPGKDSTAGHWELMGVVSPSRCPPIRTGFRPTCPDHRARAGREPLCNRPSNGIEAIETFGAEHLRTGRRSSTQQDSVLQIATHVEVIDPRSCIGCASRSASGCPRARGRARDRAAFEGPEHALQRTDGRRDYSIAPPARSYLVELHEAGVEVHTVGKAGQLFAGSGWTSSIPARPTPPR